MKRLLCIALAAGHAAGVGAQGPSRPAGSAEKPPAAAAVTYDSAFRDYRPYADPDLARWRDVNEEMGRLNGHVGHVPGALGPHGGAPSQKPPAHSGHGSHPEGRK